MKPIRYYDENTDIVVKHAGDEFLTPLYAIPDGFKIVPIEPTNKMSMAGTFLDDRSENVIQYSDNIYKAMIEAAPNLGEIL